MEKGATRSIQKAGKSQRIETKILCDFDGIPAAELNDVYEKVWDRCHFVMRTIFGDSWSGNAYVSPGGSGIHVVLTVGFMVPDVYIVLVQSLCGSDWKRETFNVARMIRNRKNWNVLFDTRRYEEVL